jgi:hypothetical protein
MGDIEQWASALLQDSAGARPLAACLRARHATLIPDMVLEIIYERPHGLAENGLGKKPRIKLSFSLKLFEQSAIIFAIIEADHVTREHQL